MKLLSKHIFLFFISTFFTIGIAGAALWGLQDVKANIDQLLQGDVRINDLANKFGRELSKSREAEKQFFVFPDNLKQQNKFIISWNKSYDLILVNYFDELDLLLRKSNDRDKLTMVAQARQLMNQNLAEWKKITDKFKQTKSYRAVVKAEYGPFLDRTEKIEDFASRLIEGSLQDVLNSRQKLNNTRAQMELVIQGILLAAILWGLFVPLIVARRLKGLVGRMIKITEEIGRGQAGSELNVSRGDELGELANSITRMQRSVQAMMKNR